MGDLLHWLSSKKGVQLLRQPVLLVQAFPPQGNLELVETSAKRSEPKDKPVATMSKIPYIYHCLY